METISPCFWACFFQVLEILRAPLIRQKMQTQPSPLHLQITYTGQPVLRAGINWKMGNPRFILHLYKGVLNRRSIRVPNNRTNHNSWPPHSFWKRNSVFQVVQGNENPSAFSRMADFVFKNNEILHNDSSAVLTFPFLLCILSLHV